MTRSDWNQLISDDAMSTRQGWGKTVILGSDGNATPLSISSSDIKRGRSVHGALLGGIKPKDDIPVLVHKVTTRANSCSRISELQLDEFVTHEVGFDEINGADSTCCSRGRASGASYGWTAPRREQ
ncbi:hypothetical protein PR202_ga29144 [Eleusine coracana subsp. coracana]|uniref:Uncharacterized protein n=1 Tax=Eleusine coracana subsp. coracana TaxID=191504 RepID=A0AAV5DK26_ELECO|nr:hypothetical protein PR202_ga29144 [Eleusine coracana subsp. coracana]